MAIITLGIYNLVQCWTYNKKDIISHLEKGYAPATENDEALLVSICAMFFSHRLLGS